MSERFLNNTNVQKKFSSAHLLFSLFFLPAPTLRKCLQGLNPTKPTTQKAVYAKKSLQQPEFHLLCYQQHDASPFSCRREKHNKDHFDFDFPFHLFCN